jgi:signal peptidase I
VAVIDLALPLRRSPRGASVASGGQQSSTRTPTDSGPITGASAAERLADTAVTGGRAHDVLRGLRALEEELERTKMLAPTKRTTAAAAARAEQPLWRKVISWTFNGCILAAAIYFWPARFGGATSAVLVRGTSMLPNYELNDIVFVREQDEYEVGDIVLFEIPDGEAAGLQIIHRIIGTWDDGTWKTQGDNRPTADQFRLEDEHLMGTPVLHVPEAGRVLQLLQNTFVISAAVGAGAIMLMWPSNSARQDEDVDDELEARLAPVGADGPEPPAAMPNLVVLQGASVDAFLADLGLADPVQPAVVAEPAVTTDPPIDTDLVESHAPPTAGEMAPVVEPEDPDEAAARWLAEELASLGIEL